MTRIMKLTLNAVMVKNMVNDSEDDDDDDYDNEDEKDDDSNDADDSDRDDNASGEADEVVSGGKLAKKVFNLYLYFCSENTIKVFGMNICVTQL